MSADDNGFNWTETPSPTYLLGAELWDEVGRGEKEMEEQHLRNHRLIGKLEIEKK